MASALIDPTSQEEQTVGPFTIRVGEPAAASARSSAQASAESVAQSKKRSPMVTGLLVMAAAIVIVLGLTMGMMLVVTDVSVLAAFGLGLYCAFWLGGGFGTIFGSALVFSKHH